MFGNKRIMAEPTLGAQIASGQIGLAERIKSSNDLWFNENVLWDVGLEQLHSIRNLDWNRMGITEEIRNQASFRAFETSLNMMHWNLVQSMIKAQLDAKLEFEMRKLTIVFSATKNVTGMIRFCISDLNAESRLKLVDACKTELTKLTGDYDHVFLLK